MISNKAYLLSANVTGTIWGSFIFSYCLFELLTFQKFLKSSSWAKETNRNTGFSPLLPLFGINFRHKIASSFDYCDAFLAKLQYKKKVNK